MTIGEKITIYRNNRGFSQDELAYKVGANAELLRAWEEDREIPNAVNLLALKSALGVDIDDLLSDNKKAVKRMSGKQKALSLTLFISSCASFFIALILALILLPLSNGNFAKNFWVFFLFAPVAIGSIIYGFMLKKKGFSAKKNLIAGFTAVFVLFPPRLAILPPQTNFCRRLRRKRALLFQRAKTSTTTSTKRAIRPLKARFTPSARLPSTAKTRRNFMTK